MHNFFFVLLSAFIAHVFAASQIALFSDDNCQESLRGIEGPNGYPNGTCTDLRRNGAYGSFQVVGLDPGCTVTIYMNDTTVDMCSGYQEEIQPIDCYNSTFAYYSIDFCDAGALPTSTASPSSPSPASSGLSTGAIVGAAVGGGIALGIIIGLAVFLVMRKRNSARLQEARGSTELTSVTPVEVHAKHLQELGTGAVAYKHHPVEIEQPPVELAGMEMRRDEGKRLH
ncbi:hypothetical protein ACET3X_007742 [Alternaria dauci]|uniref:Uncharacterized protein n=1 Tax=Alternaria dauci TaxID=48095 RepID=A0ABR3UCU4_9PLEO